MGERVDGFSPAYFFSHKMMSSILILIFYAIIPWILAAGMVALAIKPTLIREEKQWFFKKYRILVLVLGILFLVGNTMNILQTISSMDF